MAKRFRQNKAVWLSYGTFLLQQGQSDAASALLQRALKSLPSKESKTAWTNQRCNKKSRSRVRGRVPFICAEVNQGSNKSRILALKLPSSSHCGAHYADSLLLT